MRLAVQEEREKARRVAAEEERHRRLEEARQRAAEAQREDEARRAKAAEDAAAAAEVERRRREEDEQRRREEAEVQERLRAKKQDSEVRGEAMANLWQAAAARALRAGEQERAQKVGADGLRAKYEARSKLLAELRGARGPTSAFDVDLRDEALWERIWAVHSKIADRQVFIWKFFRVRVKMSASPRFSHGSKYVVLQYYL